MTEILVIGAGHNGLVAATLLAKAGHAVTIVERSDRLGGCARTSELAPNFHCPTLAHAAAIDPSLVRALGLERLGLTILRPEAAACAPVPNGPALTLWRDPARAADSIRAWSRLDAERYPAFLSCISQVSRVVHAVCGMAPPSIEHPTAADLLRLLNAGRQFRALSTADARRLLRWAPMAVADLVSEWFESEPLCATIAATGVLGSFLGPRSAGSAAVFLLLTAAGGSPVAPGWFARGGAGAVADTLALAARGAGVTIRTNADVTEIAVTEGTATGVVLTSGEELSAKVVFSNADPKRTLSLVDPVHVSPELLARLRNFRARGTLAKVNFAVSALPAFSCPAAALTGRVRLAANVDAIERAFDASKYGRFSDSPWIELTIPSLVDPSLAPSGMHVVSAYVQYTPYRLRGSHWDAEREILGRVVTSTIAAYAPGFESSILAREVITPLDLEREYGLTGGHIFHGELALDQLFIARPFLGWPGYRTPIANLYLCGSGTHPGTGLTGRSGALAAKAFLTS